ncbi:acyl-CoA dehydrogenase family protein [Novosphingobium album (ex Liu et al. 2023)]|uniref:Acyl-CoA/acyl-ACP dehydrogenase n=1 Tax=Novosphingobium album (ex Liu et al. 2023) TaxID=3031130 RepID=A0ABT5WLR3_9SPHN|nr:acyl-CoA dehydrogenase family protein [Novosphingobium album (ex Liu et al. 2023)]MDE8650980.1 acyl-CoA/acyl-ACP dehydrogenase [Novosphingobium album (ex Liu et al. 2023)]
MDFALTDEQRMLAETARRIGEKFGLDYWRALDADKAFPSEIWQAICDAGLCGVAVPQQYGGSGLGMLELAICVENLCAGGGGVTLSQMFMLNPIFGGVTLARLANEEQKAEMLPKLVGGELMFAMGLTEPNAGSNTLEIQTFAAEDGDGWRLSGQKVWITAVPQAHKLLVIARTKTLAQSRGKTDGLSLFVIDREREGLTHQAIDKLGTRTLPSSFIYFDNVRVDPHELVGTLHGGFRQLLDVLNTERIVTTAGLVGTAELAARLAIDYAKERKVFGGQPIGGYQAIQFPLAESHIQAECARLMNYKAAALHDAGQPYGSEANMGKWLAGHAAGQATDRAIQTMGGMGYSKEYHAERLWRDARLFRIAPISEEMVLNFVAQHDLGMPRSY